MIVRKDPERDLAILRKVEAGESVKAVAETYSLHRERVRQIVAKFGRMRGHWSREGQTFDEFCAEFSAKAVKISDQVKEPIRLTRLKQSLVMLRKRIARLQNLEAQETCLMAEIAKIEHTLSNITAGSGAVTPYRMKPQNRR